MSETRSMKCMIKDPRRKAAVKVRNGVESIIDHYFETLGYEKVRTPLLVSSPGLEPHIRPFKILPACEHDENLNLYVPTSPEFAMKRLLVGGLPKIYQITPAFRFEPESTTHLPEFTMLEWYEVNADYKTLMLRVEGLFFELGKQLLNSSKIIYQEQQIDLSLPWTRLKIRDLFIEHLGIDLFQSGKWIDLKPVCLQNQISVSGDDTWDDLYFKLWLNCVEPKLPKDRPVFVYGYPESQAALSVIEELSDGSRWARRFEVYVGGIELANAFEELCDPKEQRLRFEKDMKLREKIYGNSFPACPIDEKFMAALEEGMPFCSGIAMGVDRLIMLFGNEPDIHYTFWIPPTL